jgi:MFS family permease
MFGAERARAGSQGTHLTATTIVAPAKASAGYRYVVVATLAIVYTFNFLDRQIVSILGKDISTELHLTKTQFGLLGGTAFAIFYTVCGIPVAWLCDRGNRILIMSAACAIWSAFTALCGSAQSFTQIMLCRMGVGFGEAGGSPPSYSLISDYFPPKERGVGLAIYSLGVPLGSMLGAFVGQRIAAAYSWRMAFVVVGLPGILIALTMLALIREPKRGALDPLADGAAHEPAPPLWSAIGRFFAQRTLTLTAVASALSAFVGYAGLLWNPQFLQIVKQMPAARIGDAYAVTLGLTGIVGTFGAGWLADRLTQHDRRWFAWVPAIAFLVSIPFWAGLLWAPSWQLALVFMAGPMLLNSVYLAPALAITQNAVAPAQRTIAGAIMLFVLNLVGLGVGPVYVGRVADMMEPAHGKAAIAYGYAALIPIIVITVIAHLASASSIARDKRLAAAA